VDFASPAVVLAALEELRALPAWAKIALAFVVVDFILYWIHRAQHRFECGWRTHRWHHSAQELYWFSGFRTSFLHSFFYNIPQTVVPMHLFHLSPLEAGIGYSIGLFVQFWEHTNVNANIGWLKYILITPQYHRLHHAAAIRPSVNLAPTFCVWDRLFGTYMDPDKAPADYPLGLGEPIRARDVPRMLVGV
jgi:sterol desaturase/sphingolipid hydroxylase (fatty acid hydroxylase superfamily)